MDAFNVMIYEHAGKRFAHDLLDCNIVHGTDAYGQRSGEKGNSAITTAFRLSDR